MAEPAITVRESGLWLVVKKRWRAWLRAFHRDFGYLAVGVIDERETSRSSGLPIGGEHDLGWCSDARQMFA